MQKGKRWLVFFVVAGLLTLLVGCNGVNGKSKGTGTLKIILSDQKSGSLQTVSDQIELSRIMVTVSKNSTVLTQEITYNGGNTAEVTFTNLVVGEWNVNVVAKDVDGHSCYGGNATPSVAAGVNTIEVPLHLLNGDLDVKVKLPNLAGLNITSGKVKLANPITGVHEEKDLLINNAEGIVDYGPVKAGTWYVEAELFENGNKLVWGSGVLTVLPDRENTAIIEFGSSFQGGDLTVIVIINESPSDPTGLTATMQNSSVVLNWNANPEQNIAGYTVYRATSENAFKKLLTYSLISDTTYTDSDIQLGEKYYYWVQAYDYNGYSSELSELCSIDTRDIESEISIDLSQYNQVIYVNQNIGDDATGDGSVENPYKSVTKARSMAMLDNTAVYISGEGMYEIPGGLISLLKLDMRLDYIVNPSIFGKVMFNLIISSGPTRQMSQFNNFIGIVFESSHPTWSGGYYENFGQSDVKINLYNCVFDNKGSKIPDIFPISIGFGTYDPIQEMNYYNCSFIPSFQFIDESELYFSGNFVNCSFTQSNFTSDGFNLHGVTFDSAFNITSSNWKHTGTGENPDGTQANMGVYGGQYAWGKW